MENSSRRVGNDCLVTIVATGLHMGPDMWEALCEEEEEDINLEGSQWCWRGDWNGLFTCKQIIPA